MGETFTTVLVVDIVSMVNNRIWQKGYHCPNSECPNKLYTGQQ